MEMQFLVISYAGFWGIGRTLCEACKNAEVKRERCDVYRLPTAMIKGNFKHTSYGGASWQWSPQVFNQEWNKEIPLEVDYLLTYAKELARIADGRIVTVKNESVTIEY